MKMSLRYALFFLPQFLFPGWVFCFVSRQLFVPFLAAAIHFLLVYLSGYVLLERVDALVILVVQSLVYCCSLALQTLIAFRLLPLVSLRNAHQSDDSRGISLHSAIPFFVASLVAIALALRNEWSFYMVRPIQVDAILGAGQSSESPVRFCTKATQKVFRNRNSKKILGDLVLVKVNGKKSLARIAATHHEKVTAFKQDRDFVCFGNKEKSFKVDRALGSELQMLQLPPSGRIALLHDDFLRRGPEPRLTISLFHLTDLICVVETHQRTRSEGC